LVAPDFSDPFCTNVSEDKGLPCSAATIASPDAGFSGRVLDVAQYLDESAVRIAASR